MKNIHKINSNIYITSDEDIEKGDWFYLDDAIIVTKYINVKPGKEAQKIILTTDQEIIKDSVQAIDDEFLEWFVKNSICERVDVEWVDFSWSYFIIILKEVKKLFYCSERLELDDNEKCIIQCDVCAGKYKQETAS